jgi:Bor protein
MPLRSRLVPLLALCFAGCYHASVETGRPPGSQHIEKGWASSYLGGAISPSTVDARSACASGVSKVETKHSFLNMLVGGLTLAIYTPMSIDVTCAAAPAAQTQRPVSSVAVGKTSASR